jgi:hypothetical protein
MLCYNTQISKSYSDVLSLACANTNFLMDLSVKLCCYTVVYVRIYFALLDVCIGLLVSAHLGNLQCILLSTASKIVKSSYSVAGRSIKCATNIYEWDC